MSNLTPEQEASFARIDELSADVRRFLASRKIGHYNQRLADLGCSVGIWSRPDGTSAYVTAVRCVEEEVQDYMGHEVGEVVSYLGQVARGGITSTARAFSLTLPTASPILSAARSRAQTLTAFGFERTTTMPEPAPVSTPQSEPVWDFIRQSDLLHVDNVRILYALEARVDFGYDKYGTVLQTHNGRDALQDAREELLDLVFYAAQAYLEGKLTYARWQDSLESVLTLWRALGGA